MVRTEVDFRIKELREAQKYTREELAENERWFVERYSYDKSI